MPFERTVALARARTVSLRKLAAIAGADFATFYRYGDFRNLDLSRQDLRGADLTGADFEGIWLDGETRFDPQYADQILGAARERVVTMLNSASDQEAGELLLQGGRRNGYMAGPTIGCRTIGDVTPSERPLVA